MFNNIESYKKDMRLFICEFWRLLKEGDLRLPNVLLGIGLVLWGLIGYFVVPTEVTRAASRFALGDSPLLWAFNYTGIGLLYIYMGVKSNPNPLTLLVGAYSSMVWTIIAISRPTDTFTSGVTLNLVVVLMGIMNVYRSGSDARLRPSRHEVDRYMEIDAYNFVDYRDSANSSIDTSAKDD